jgi:ribosomal protein S20
MQSDSTTNCEEQMKSRHKTTLQFHAAAKQNDEEEINSYRKTTLHALDAAAKQNIYI